MAHFVPDLLQRAEVEPRDRVLDLACGTGIVASGVARRLPGDVSVTGVDLNPGMLAVARSLAASEGLDVTFEQGDARRVALSGRFLRRRDLPASAPVFS